MKKNDTSWNTSARWYDDLLETNADTYQARVILPNLLRILSPRPKLRVLDLACGQGYFSRAFAEKGAIVTGIDISPELIKKAREHSPETISYAVASADKLTTLRNASFDVAIVVLALQNIENLEGSLAECRRVLAKGGRLLIVLNHPAFRVPKRSAWGFDEEKKVQYRRVDAYLSDSRETIEMHPGQRGGATTVSFHRPLQVYVKALAKSGFAVTRLEEWISHRTSQPGVRAKAEDTARKEIPLFLFLEATLL